MQRFFLSLCVSVFYFGCGDKTTPEAQPEEVAEPKEQEPKAEAPPEGTEIPYDGKVLENVPYRFSLAQPAAGWKLLDKAEARKLVSDAQAALSTPSGVTAVVIVEQLSDITLDGLADLLLDAMALENKKITSRETVRYVGMPAIAYEVTGHVNDVQLNYAGRIFLREGFAYQVIAYAPVGKPAAKDFDRVFNSFSLSAGGIKPVSDNAASPDMIGQGWRLQDGVFESAVSGLIVEPKGDWRVLVGADARRMNADAEVVLVHEAPEAYFLVIPELIGDASQETYTKSRVEQTASNMTGEVSRKIGKATLLGKGVDSVVLTASEMPWTFEVAVGFNDEWAIQATGWYSKGAGEKGQKALAEALEAVSLLGKKKQKKLRETLLALPDEQDHVGKHHSLRSGIYRDYEHGVEWTKPKGFWELSVGQEARAINPIAQLYGRYANSALHVLVVAETVDKKMSAKKYHEMAFSGVQQNLNLKTIAKEKARRTKIGSGKALQTSAVTETGAIKLGYRVITAVEGTNAVQLHIWGVESGMKRNAGALASAIKNLKIRREMNPVAVKKGVYTNYRMGFSMELPGKFPLSDATPPEITGIASFPNWGTDGGRWVGVLAICSIEAGKDREWSMNVTEERMRDSYSELVGGVEPTKRQTELFGGLARHLSWKTEEMRLDAYLIGRHQTIYAIVASEPGGTKKMIDTALTGFSFIP